VVLPTPPKVIIFDFDGVILDSAEIKLHAYAVLYADEAPEKIQVLLQHAWLNGGITRRTKIEYYERNLFGRSGDVETVEALAQRYSEIVYQAVLRCPFVEGAEALLERASAADVAMHVVSGTPERELRQIIAKRNLSHFFRSVWGAPATKPDSFRKILVTEGYGRAETLAVGDSHTEYLAARNVGIPFLGIVPQGSENPFPADVVVCQSLVDSDKLLKIK
jgi:phosphoglycolate phosphatase-like HAD superfamily hydrolase